MKKNDKKTKVEMNAADLKKVSGGEYLVAPLPYSPITISPIFVGDFRHW